MPATRALRASNRLASRIQGPATTLASRDRPVPISTPASAKVTRKIRSAPARGIQKKTLEDFDISDSDDPPTVKEAFLTPLLRLQELEAMKKAHDELSQKLAQVKWERAQLFPIIAAVEELLDCFICNLYMSRPVSLPCGHIFCKACFDVASEAQKTEVYLDEEGAEKALQFLINVFETFVQFREQISLYIERQKMEIISDYEEKEPEAAANHKKMVDAAAEELRKIVRNNIEAALVVEEQQVLYAARKDMHQNIVKRLRRSYDRKVKDLHGKLTEINLFNNRMLNVITALKEQL
ncbi:hypothetical protein HYPSUDRAFT_204360 [Hypholoma sublateritium FD-334 SS-4]|uniref:RING-type domain-containing protein n=1 Tax=Hypholoma sublateritium (strain FD-334 SS-4) TaxID=945553 RepID=A0A0D2M8Y0_HYPSF|nr:hypothetical protein HYPSUDRAFT_204360 [Hypholoma sublateritium FD-334 SS-4]